MPKYISKYISGAREYISSLELPTFMLDTNAGGLSKLDL